MADRPVAPDEAKGYEVHQSAHHGRQQPEDDRTLGASTVVAGFGYSLVYPGLGVEAVKRAPPQSRGLAMGAYTVFLDVALGFGSPALGLLAGWTGLGSVFLASAVLVLGAAVVAGWLLHTSNSRAIQLQNT